MIILSCPRDHDALASLRDHDPVVQRYRTFFAYLDWTVIPERDTTRPWPGPLPHPTSAYVKALLVKLREHKEYVTHLRVFLSRAPLARLGDRVSTAGRCHAALRLRRGTDRAR